MISLGAAKLLGIIFETLGYGAFFVMFMYNMYLQLRNLSDKSAKRPNMLLLVSSTLLFMLITSRWAIGVARVYEAVVVLEGRITVSEYFADVTLKKQTAVSTLLQFQVLVADFILVYRLYHVWKPYWWICIIPTLVWFGDWVSNCFLIWAMPRASTSSGVFQRELELWITSSFCFIILNNVYCTTAIAFRLWRSHHIMGGANPNSYVLRALRVFVESASLLAIFLIVTFGAFLGGQNIQYSLLDATSPVIGISFLLILLRLNFDERGPATTNSPMTSQRGVSANYTLRPITVTIGQQVDVHSDMESNGAGKDCN